MVDPTGEPEHGSLVLAMESAETDDLEIDSDFSNHRRIDGSDASP
jgi:hypothetical protein